MCVCLWYKLELKTQRLPAGTNTRNCRFFYNSRFHLLDARAEEGIVQVDLAGSPQADIWRALRLQET